MSTLVLDAPDLDVEASQDDHPPLEITDLELLKGATAYADLPQIQRLVAKLGIDLRDPSSRPAGFAFTVLKHLGPRKTDAQLEALAWFLDQGIYDDNYRLRDVVRRMVDSGLNTK
ncbi:TPA: hypothetical protein QDB45_001625 [Burkholderia vietnamiensis]|nr:hypothetical protein [Burkholderia vietnamiensis]